MTGIGEPWGEDGLTVPYRHGDRTGRREFARELARYVRGHRDRWNIATFLGALDLLGRDVAELRLTLLRRPDGRLAVTIDYELAPVRPDGGEDARRASGRPPRTGPRRHRGRKPHG